MTRYLSSALGAQQPLFGQSIMELERASGHPSADIHLSSELMQKVRVKIGELGLDPSDTTGQELYGALQGRLKGDDTKIRAALGISEAASTSEILSHVQTFLQKYAEKTTTFALKPSVAKRLFKKKAPKNAMKRLGYRSLDSMLKHEAIGAIFAAMAITESASWQRAFYDQYAALQPSDFEQRAISVVYPQAERWERFAESFVGMAKHNILCFKELGSVVMLPISEKIDALTITSLLLVLHYMNDVQTYSSFAKLQQVKPTFGKVIQQSVASEPMTSATLAGQAVPWKVIQRYYGKLQSEQHPEVFEPHVQPEDMRWHEGEKILANLEPTLAFWQGTQYVCMLQDGEPVSLNMLDIALSYCNHLSFTDRIVHFVREHLWHELMSRYLHEENLESAVHQQLSRDLIDDTALAELA
jgi:hypothetical protein